MYGLQVPLKIKDVKIQFELKYLSTIFKRKNHTALPKLEIFALKRIEPWVLMTNTTKCAKKSSKDYVKHLIDKDHFNMRL